jgi:hypothetical protein
MADFNAAGAGTVHTDRKEWVSPIAAIANGIGSKRFQTYGFLFSAKGTW